MRAACRRPRRPSRCRRWLTSQTINNVDHYYKQLKMLPGGLQKFDEMIANMQYEK